MLKMTRLSSAFAVALAATLAAGTALAGPDSKSSQGAGQTNGATLIGAVNGIINNLDERLRPIINEQVIGTADAKRGRNSYIIGQFGRSGAVTGPTLTVWGAATGSRLKNTFESNSFTGSVKNGMVGADIRLTDWLLTGLGLAYEDQNFNTFYNAGKSTTDGWSVAPYLLIRLHRNVYVDGSFSFTRLNTDTQRQNNTIFGNYDSNRYVGSVNLHTAWAFGDIRFGTQVGYLYIHQKDEGYNEYGAVGATVLPSFRSSIGQGRAGIRLGYNLGWVEPYVSVRAEYDFVDPNSGSYAPGVDVPTWDRTGGWVGAGLRFNLAPNLSATVQGNTIFSRQDRSDTGGLATFRLSF